MPSRSGLAMQTQQRRDRDVQGEVRIALASHAVTVACVCIVPLTEPHERGEREINIPSLSRQR